MTRLKPGGSSDEPSKPSERSTFERLRQGYKSWRLALENLLEDPGPGVMVIPRESVFLEHPYLAPVATPQQLEIIMAQVEHDPELLCIADQMQSSHTFLVEANQLLTTLEERLLGPVDEGQTGGGQPERTPEGFLPYLERDSRRVLQLSHMLIGRLHRFTERLGADKMTSDSFEVPEGRPLRDAEPERRGPR